MHNTTEIENEKKLSDLAKKLFHNSNEGASTKTILFYLKKGAEWQKLNSDSTAENKGQQKGEDATCKYFLQDHIEKEIEHLTGVIEYGSVHAAIYTAIEERKRLASAIEVMKEFKEKYNLVEHKGDKPEELQEEVERLWIVAKEYEKLVDQVRRDLVIACNEIYTLKAALEKISTTQLNSPTEAEGRFYDCIGIAEEALNQK